jgi:two-component system OmpR family response regulator
LFVDGRPLELTSREWLIVECLALNSGRIVTKERLQQAVAGWDEAITPNAVEVHVSRVRAKLGDAVVLRAVRGLGYRLDEPR